MCRYTTEYLVSRNNQRIKMSNSSSQTVPEVAHIQSNLNLFCAIMIFLHDQF